MSVKGSLEVNRLIAEVHQRPELWDRQHPQHHNRSVLERHWESVATTLSINGKAARGKWKNLKDHFRKEYKRCMTMNSDQEISRWPYFHSMMFIKEQISHTVLNSVFLPSDFQYENIYPQVEIGAESEEDNPFNCLNVEYDNHNAVQVRSENSNPDENMSDDKLFLLSLLPIFSALPTDRKLKARIAIETCLLNTAYPKLSTDDNSQAEQNGLSQKSSRKSQKRKCKSEDESLTKRSSSVNNYC